MILESAIILSLANTCQTTLDSDIITRLINNESSGKPFAIAVKGLSTFNQPTNEKDAISSIKKLESLGFNYSVGLMQINYTNFKYAGLTPEAAFNYCDNIKAGAKIFNDCHVRAKKKFRGKSDKFILDSAASCYYSGNFTFGFKKEGKSQISYVEKFNRITNNKTITASNNNSQATREDLSKKATNNVHSWDVFRDFSY